MVLDPNFILKVILTLVCAAILSLAATPLVKHLAHSVGAMDIPKDDRRMHKAPIPRMGGLAIFLGFMISVLIFVDIDVKVRGILLGAVVILILGVLDDILALHAIPKFLVQIVAAVIVVCHGCYIDQIFGWVLPDWLSYGVSVLWIVAMTNAINFIDGLDGLAAGVSAISAGAMLVVALMLVPQGNSAVSALLLAAVVGGCIGFIPYNFNPAKIFMGDTGSNFLGFILASISIFGLFKTYAFISFAVPFLVLGLPLFDICFAVIRRILRGQSPMHADRGHFHHRLIDMGFSQKQAVAICYLLTAILGLVAVTLTGRRFEQVLIIAGALALVIAIGFVLVFNRHHHKMVEAVALKNSDGEVAPAEQAVSEKTDTDTASEEATQIQQEDEDEKA
ncbi:MAG: undecaprenyl/decaprenyl-phosphate alpha-N-acetylglucosaminyl 1-phosphate transferase [Oscillospiraceae bacterium]|nr:undecaprenyl/decaprenyl-phosphate alpha-N-acetylglucosaminyl 1-phosphate transferase [Oscillospiraceae bacterium]